MTASPETKVSFIDLFRVFLKEEFGDTVITSGESLPGHCLIRLRIKENDGSFTHSLIGDIRDNTVYLTTYGLDRYFDWRIESKNAADPELFQWFTSTVKCEYYSYLREMGIINKNDDDDITTYSKFGRSN